MENNFIYLDNASTTPLSENVLNIINSTYRNYWQNPSSTYELGIKCSTYLEKIRSKIAYIFEADPEDIIFTSGSSESTNICLLYTSPSPRDLSTSRMPSSA